MNKKVHDYTLRSIGLDDLDDRARTKIEIARLANDIKKAIVIPLPVIINPMTFPAIKPPRNWPVCWKVLKNPILAPYSSNLENLMTSGGKTI